MKRYWIAGSQFGIYHADEKCEGLADTFPVEVAASSPARAERKPCPACTPEAAHKEGD